jgi:hypothetical protein
MRLCAHPVRELLAHGLLLHRDWARAARRALGAIAQLADVNFQFADGAAEGVAVHAQFARGAALVALVFLKDGKNEALLEFAHAFGVEDVAFVHLQNECFQLIFHDASLFVRKSCQEIVVRKSSGNPASNVSLHRVDSKEQQERWIISAERGGAVRVPD